MFSLRRTNIALALSCLAASSCTLAADYVDLHSWTQAGASSAGNWTVAPNGHSVYQSINGEPTAFMSTEKYSYRTFKGVIKVDSNAGDDDWIGFILGDPNSEFYIFDWKKGDQSGASKGYKLIHHKGSLSTFQAMGWGPSHESNTSTNTILARNTSKGWTHGTSYNFEMQVYANRIVTKIDGNTIFDVSGLDIKPSRFGFFNWSQGKVNYNAIEQLYPPIASEITEEITQGVSKTVRGSWTDQNETDTHTCKLLGQPKYGTVTFVSPCSFTFVPDPDHDGAQTFQYRVTDNSNLYTDGTVTLNVLSAGSSIDMPHYIEAEETTTVNMNLKSLGTGVFDNPSVSVRNMPNFMSYDNETGILTMTPGLEDLGLYEGIQFTTSNNGHVSFDAGVFDLAVIPQGNNDFLKQSFVVVPSETPLADYQDNLVATIEIPALKSGEDKLVEGPHIVTVKADASNLAPVIIEGTQIAPGESVSMTIDLSRSGTSIPMRYSSKEEGVSKVTINFPWIDSPEDLRYVFQRTCASTDSSRCSPALEMDRVKVPSGQVQVVIRKAADASYLTYGFAAVTWASTDLAAQISTLTNDDIIAVNLNVNNASTKAMLSALSSKLGNNVLNGAVNSMGENSSLVYQVGKGLESFKTDNGYRWGTSAVTWVNLDD